MTKIFTLGTTGYIGGDALYAITQAHPEYEITCLVRNSDKGVKVAQQYSKARLVYGDLDNFDLIVEEAAKADIVCHWAHSDHEGAANAIIQGLASRPSGGYYIHTSGTGILMFSDIQAGRFGLADSKIYDDWDGIAEVTSLPDGSPHRNVDKIVLAAEKQHGGKVKTAIVCPPTIYGVGRGPDNQRSMQVPWLASLTIKQGHGAIVGEGKAYWTEVHVHDLSQLFSLLVQEAASGGGKASWGAEGYYFCQSKEFVWGDVARLVAQAAYEKGYIKTAECTSYDSSGIEKLVADSSRLWGQNSRCRAIRAKKLLGWAPKAKSLEEDIPETVDMEAKSLGVKKSHAAIAAGDTE